jgi:hypothetical protein
MLITVTMAAVLMASLRRTQNKEVKNIGYKVGAWATVFAVCAIGTFVIVVGSKFNMYYCVHFTVWPVLGLASFWEGGYLAGVSTRAKVITVGLLACSWVPSLAWNVRHIIVPIADFGSLDRSEWERILMATIPSDARVTGSTEFLILTRRCQFTFIPIPFYSEAIIPADNWILLEEYDYRAGRRINRKALAGRTIAVKGEACPLARGANRLEFVLLRPLGPAEDKDRDRK